MTTADMWDKVQFATAFANNHPHPTSHGLAQEAVDCWFEIVEDTLCRRMGAKDYLAVTVGRAGRVLS